MSETVTNRPYVRDRARQEYEFYMEHGRPSRPYYILCSHCEESHEVEGSLLDADYDVRRHAGVHGGLDEVKAELVVTDSTGRELFRHHAIHRPEDGPETCESCGAVPEPGRIACPDCGHIPEEARA